MANKNVSVKILQVTKTTAEWAEVTSTIDRGLLCVEMTTDNKTKIKVGDGLHTYDLLPYVGGDADLSDYYTKLEVDEAIDEAISSIGDVLSVKGVVATKEQLPTQDNKPGDVWFVGPDADSHYSEYAWIQPDPEQPGSWEEIGTSEIDLSAYATTQYVDDIADGITDRLTALEADEHTHTNKNILDLTTAPFTTELQEKLESLVVYTDFTGATAEEDGAAGLVPAPQAGDQGKFLRGDGSWVDGTYDDTALQARIAAIEEDYLKSTDYLIMNCSL